MPFGVVQITSATVLAVTREDGSWGVRTSGIACKHLPRKLQKTD